MLQLRLALVMTALAACGPKQTDEHGSESETASTTTGTGEPSPVTGDTGKTTGSGSQSCPDPNSFMSNSECFCNVGYEWCSPEDPGDLSCCESNAGMTAAGTTSAGSTSAGSTSAGTSRHTGTEARRHPRTEPARPWAAPPGTATATTTPGAIRGISGGGVIWSVEERMHDVFLT